MGCPSGTACQVFDGNTAGCIPFSPGKPDGSPCAGATIGGCGKGSWCVEAYPTDPLAYCASPCKGDADCAPGLDCSLYAAGAGICQKHGKAKAGDSCANDRFACQKGLFCIGAGSASAACTPICQQDSDCAVYAGQIGKAAWCAKGPAGGGACQPKGDLPNGAGCGKDPKACAAGSWCVGGYDGYNPDAWCQQPCGAAKPCPAGSVCTTYTDAYAGCQPDGKKGQGEPCAGDPTACKAGSLCLGPQGGEVCASLCKPGAAAGSAGACPAGSWCSAWGAGGGVCLPSGATPIGKPCAGKPFSCAPGSFCQGWGKGGDAACIAACGPGITCPAGTDCKVWGELGSWCQPVGGAGQGQPCTASANACAPGLACIAAGTGYAMCAKACSQDKDCAAPLHCTKGTWGGWCIPSGSLALYESCFGKAWQCQQGLACLGDPVANPGAFCSKACAGFADVCGAGAKCQYYGNGQAWCAKTGKLPHGAACTGTPGDCDASTLCVKGTPLPLCLQQCGSGFPPCPTDSPCTWFAGSAVQLCVPKGFIVGGVVRIPF